ncbi:MAG: gliding motility-associated ABC transporter permease subunit GldF [Bacteroidales bacterium]|nr:gliding motility-associated ABC transporter permease subunit GldF [Bacteroidales bacterium]
MLALFRKEISSFLNSLTGYLVIAVFLLINGMFLWVFSTEFNLLDFGYANLDGLFVLAPFVFLFLVPAICMRSFADEQKSGTIEMLLTKPITDLQIITAKYLSSLSLVIFSLIPTLIYYFTVYQLGLPKGNLDMGGIMGSYIGLFFLGATFTAIGIFSSSITDNQILSFILAAIISGFMYLGFEFIFSFSLFGPFDLFIKQMGISSHYSSISRGVIDTRDILYFLSVIALFLSFTKLALSARRW